MAVKDHYGNNLRRGHAVADRREKQEGEVVATNTNRQGFVLVKWESDEEELVSGGNLILKDRSFR